MLAEAGFDCLDFSFGESGLNWTGGKSEFDYYKRIEEIRAFADKIGIPFNQAHAPFSTNPEDKEGLDAVIKSIELAAVLGVRQIVVHPMHYLKYKGNEDELKRVNYNFYSSLLPYAEKNRIKIAVENMWQFDSNRNYIVHDTCASPKEFCEYVDMMDSEWIIACLDIGHCALVGEDIPEMIHALGHKRLHALHVHDVDYRHDNHTLPGIERLNYTEVVKALAEIAYEGEFTLEAGAFLTGFEPEFMPEATRFMATRARFLADKLDSYRAMQSK